MPDLGRSTRESGEARLASWRVSPSRVIFMKRTLLVVVGTFFAACLARTTDSVCVNIFDFTPLAGRPGERLQGK